MQRVSYKHPSALSSALTALSQGSPIIMPTDTVYGIGCRLEDSEALATIFQIKRRSPEKKIALLVASIEMAERYVIIDHEIKKGLSRVWPGALTGIFWSKDKKEKIGVRIPSDTFVLLLIERLKSPLAVSSANISDKPAFTRVDDVVRTFGEEARVGCIIDGGDLPDSMASTVVDFTTHPYSIVRKGPLSKSALEDIFRVSFS